MIALKAGSILSLDIGPILIKGVLGKEVKTGLKIEEAFMFNTPDGTVSDGHIADLAGLGTEIHKQLKTRKITPKHVVFTITSTEVVTRELLLPSVKNKEIAQMITFEVDKLLPIQMEQYILDYSVLAKVVTEDTSVKSRVLVAAMPKAMAEGYWRLAAKLQLKPLSLTIHACSIAQLFQQQMQLNGKDFDLGMKTVFLDLGYSFTECNVIHKGNLLFHRTINMGDRSLITESGFPDLDDRGIDVNRFSKEGPDVVENTQVQDPAVIKIESLGAWLQEIRRVLWYFSSLNPENKLEKIILTGECTDIPGLAEYVTEIMEIPAEVLDSISIVNREKNWKNTLKYYLNAIGAIKRK